MSKAVSRGQALQVSARVATQINWDEIDGDKLQQEVINLAPEEFGRQFTAFLQNGARMIMNGLSVLWTLISDGRNAAALTQALKAKDRRVTERAAQVMATEKFAAEITSGVAYQLVGIRGDEFTAAERTTANIFKEAARRGYRKPPAFLAALLREQFTQEQLDYPYVAVMHEPITVGGDPLVLVLDRGDDEEWLSVWYAFPGSQWYRGFLFLFLAPQN